MNGYQFYIILFELTVFFFLILFSLYGIELKITSILEHLEYIMDEIRSIQLYSSSKALKFLCNKFMSSEEKLP